MNYEIDVDDGLAQTIESALPDAVDIEVWMAMQIEQAISEEHLQQRKQQLQQSAEQQMAGPPEK